MPIGPPIKSWPGPASSCPWERLARVMIASSDSQGRDGIGDSSGWRAVAPVHSRSRLGPTDSPRPIADRPVGWCLVFETSGVLLKPAEAGTPTGGLPLEFRLQPV